VSGAGELAALLRRVQAAVEEKAATEACRDAAVQFARIWRSNTPVLTGALQGSERIDSVSGGGTHAEATLSTHEPAYASFREHGGTIRVKRARVLTNHVEFFGRQVTQAGSWYTRRTLDVSGPALEQACRDALNRVISEA
jgi:hypothetical protein